VTVVEAVVHGLGEAESGLAEAALSLRPAGLVRPLPLLFDFLLDYRLLVIPGTAFKPYSCTWDSTGCTWHSKMTLYCTTSGTVHIY